MAYSELIKNFEKIRVYMRDFYVYGFHTRNDFAWKSPVSCFHKNVFGKLSGENENRPVCFAYEYAHGVRLIS